MANIFETKKGFAAAADRLREQRDEAAEMIDKAAESAGEIYDAASDWVYENRRTVAIGAAVIAVGILGYLAFGENGFMKPRQRRFFG